ncbi:MAG: hypothetical protein ACI4S3_07650 [Candidatus Gastranaerophilaceae bacterium]
MEKILLPYKRKEGISKYIEDLKNNKDKHIKILKKIYSPYLCNDEKSYNKFIEQEYNKILDYYKEKLEDVKSEISLNEQNSSSIAIKDKIQEKKGE